jgi:hypothetical protein
MRKVWMFLLPSVLALLLGGSTPSDAVDPFPPLGSYECVEFSPLPLGTPAIHPHLSAIPAYTAEDVRNYIQQTNPQVTVLRVLFISSQEVCNRLRGESTGYPSETLVCLVELQGVFYPHSYPPGYHPQPSLYAYEVYDAQTGNLLMFSG